MEEVHLTLTRNEIAALRQLIHIAVQARGMEVAEAGVVLTKKLADATPMRGNGQGIEAQAVT